MLVLGLSGGLDTIEEQYYCPLPNYSHDSAAVLVEDGQVVVAIENERLSRIKHTNKFPLEAIDFCLKERGISLGDVDRIAYYWGQKSLDWGILGRIMEYEGKPRRYANAREVIVGLLERRFGVNVDDRMRFANHHVSHALSAAACSGFNEALVCSIDGMGDTGSGVVAEFRNGTLNILKEIPNESSLGRFYVRAIGFIGYRQFDEYKVMGLAPYGDPKRFREEIARGYHLEANGGFGAYSTWLSDAQLHELTRVPGDPFVQIHMDWAAALQVALETIVMHMLQHYREATGLTNLALAGGVAHNCTMNGRLLNSGLFDGVFVQPAAHDAGAAIGAALSVYYDESAKPVQTTRLETVYWGTDVGSAEEIGSEIRTWQSLIEVSWPDNIVTAAADLLAEGAAIGWVQGRSEFGPRALGNRSILADPRPAENKGRINKMIKKREAYRPFAPSVLEEHVSEYFVVPKSGTSQPFMTFVVDVQPDKRELLGAITHVDGTARIQTVSRSQNPRDWELIKAFGDRTGVPMLLNTSFNNNEEPIVDNVEDAIVCYLTTDLDYLVVGDSLVRKKGNLRDGAGALIPSIPPYTRLSFEAKPGNPDGPMRFQLRTTFDARKDFDVSESTFRLLERVDGKSSLDCLADQVPAGGAARSRGELIDSVLNLWSRRLIRMRPPTPAAG